MTQTLRARAEGIDLFRFIGAFFIMLLHTEYGNLPDVYVNAIRLSGRWAVPFFFIVSGYFLSSKIVSKNLPISTIEKSVFRLFTLLVVSSVVYILVNFYHTGNLFFKIENVLTGTNFHLWFLGSLILGYLIIWYMYALNNGKGLGLFSIIILSCALITDSYDVVIGKTLAYEAARFMLSVPFLYGGILLAKKKYKANHWWIYTLITLAGYGITLTETHLLNTYYGLDWWEPQLLIGSVIMAFGVFALSASLPIKANRFSRMGSEYSLLIYLYHPLVYFLILVAGNHMLSDQNQQFAARFNPIIGFIITVLGIIALRKLLPSMYKILNGDFKILKNPE